MRPVVDPLGGVLLLLEQAAITNAIVTTPGSFLAVSSRFPPQVSYRFDPRTTNRPGPRLHARRGNLDPDPCPLRGVP
jgi:hypothetical protein